MSTVPHALAPLARLPAAGASPVADGERALDALPLRTSARIVALVAPDGVADAEILERLSELGFLPGEPVRVLARGLFGDPLAVRVATGTFALRRAEARCVRVRIDGDAGAA